MNVHFYEISAPLYATISGALETDFLPIYPAILPFLNIFPKFNISKNFTIPINISRIP